MPTKEKKSSKVMDGIRNFIKKLRSDKKNKYYYRSGWDMSENATYGSGWTVVSDYIPALVGPSDNQKSTGQKKDERIVKKPVEVFQEIISEKPIVNMANIDGQIALVKRRMQVLRDEVGMGTLSDEEEALKFLEARKLLSKGLDEFNWATTSFDLIKKLLEKYKLQIVDFASYYKCVPMEAIDELESYIDLYEKYRDDKPVLKLIIDEGGKEQKKDPILLASSPFGKWWFILGAWDKEVEIVDDLIYHNK